MRFGGTVIAGAVVSRTAIVNEAVPVLLCASVAEQVTVVVAMPNVDPLAGEQAGVSAPSMLSIADAVYEAGAPEAPTASMLMFAGTVTIGAVVSVSVTVTVNAADPVLLC